MGSAFFRVAEMKMGGWTVSVHGEAQVFQTVYHNWAIRLSYVNPPEVWLQCGPQFFRTTRFPEVAEFAGQMKLSYREHIRADLIPFCELYSAHLCGDDTYLLLHAGLEGWKMGCATFEARKAGVTDVAAHFPVLTDDRLRFFVLNPRERYMSVPAYHFIRVDVALEDLSCETLVIEPPPDR